MNQSILVLLPDEEELIDDLLGQKASKGRAAALRAVQHSWPGVLDTVFEDGRVLVDGCLVPEIMEAIKATDWQAPNSASSYTNIRDRLIKMRDSQEIDGWEFRATNTYLLWASGRLVTAEALTVWVFVTAVEAFVGDTGLNFPTAADFYRYQNDPEAADSMMYFDGICQEVADIVAGGIIVAVYRLAHGSKDSTPLFGGFVTDDDFDPDEEWDDD